MNQRSLIALLIVIGFYSNTLQALAPAPPWPTWKTERITDDIYVIFGEGGNTTVLIPKTHDITTIYFFTRSECFGDNSSVALHCLRRSL